LTWYMLQHVPCQDPTPHGTLLMLIIIKLIIIRLNNDARRGGESMSKKDKIKLTQGVKSAG
jgi:hypothetical protein